MCVYVCVRACVCAPAIGKILGQSTFALVEYLKTTNFLETENLNSKPENYTRKS